MRPSQRRAFELELLLDDYQHVAELLGLDPAGVASQVSRSRKAIREFLAARGFAVLPLGAPLPEDAKTVTTLARETIIYRTPGGTDERR